MRKVIILSLLIGITCAAVAQPHTWLVYGTAGLTQNSNNNPYVYQDGSNTSWSIAPGIGYQFNKHITVGVQVSYSHIEGQTGADNQFLPAGYFLPSGSDITINWSAGAFFRYTQPLGNIFFVYGQANMSYFSSELHNNTYYFYPLPFLANSNNYYYEPYDHSTGGFQGQLFPAIGAKVYKGLALNFGLGGINYTTANQKFDYGSDKKSSNVQLTFGQQVNIGISDNFSFHKHHKRHPKGDATPNAEYRHEDKGGTEEDSNK